MEPPKNPGRFNARKTCAQRGPFCWVRITLSQRPCAWCPWPIVATLPAAGTVSSGSGHPWAGGPSLPGPEGYIQQLATDGPMARNVTDLALLLSVMSGPDPRAPLIPLLRPSPGPRSSPARPWIRIIAGSKWWYQRPCPDAPRSACRWLHGHRTDDHRGCNSSEGRDRALLCIARAFEEVSYDHSDFLHEEMGINSSAVCRLQRSVRHLARRRHAASSPRQGQAPP
ncbi:hypothetical protein OICFNHDK_0002 [Methylobacterium bullatum]|uniref:Uncharacterized protein n=1 Tax=Methylobacterium bullatum TaxID=570505 RepID=A0AAV4YZJ4_9HYPH|nr:hypothetical protein OICFNHDK_0002 [Methylobacterium bullatum]